MTYMWINFLNLFLINLLLPRVIVGSFYGRTKNKRTLGKKTNRNYVDSKQSYITLQLDFFTLSVCVPASQAEHWILSPASLYLQSSHSKGLVPPFSFLISPPTFSTFSSLGWCMSTLDLSPDILNPIIIYQENQKTGK